MPQRPLLGLFLFVGIFFPILGAPIEREPALNPQHPERYVVVVGDTLWDIAGKFLAHPWQWMDLWHANPQIEDPNLIYPGDVIAVRVVDGRTVAEMTRGGAVTKVSPKSRGDGYGYVRLSPQVRVSALVEPIPTIPLDAIQPFLSQTRVASVDELQHAPYVIGQADHHLISVMGDTLYARGIAPGHAVTRYDIYHVGHPYSRPTKEGPAEVLGVEATFVGGAELTRMGDPATLLVTQSSGGGILAGDRLLPEEIDTFNRNFMPHAPSSVVVGHIIDILDGSSRAARLQTVVIDKGKKDGLEVGHVLVVNQAGSVIEDPVTHAAITLPEEQSGTLLVFRVFERVSYALILEAHREMAMMDTVRSPPPAP